ncbi:MAG: hypothetical protein V1685_05535 [Parcubacteria group bacterium]
MSLQSVFRFTCSIEHFRDTVMVECGVVPLLRTLKEVRGAFVALAASKSLFEGVHYELRRGWRLNEEAITFALSWTCLCKPERMKTLLAFLKEPTAQTFSHVR